MMGRELDSAIGDAPEHIAALRKLTVAFAIGGRFDCPSSSSPEELLAEIETAREELEKAGKLKKKRAKHTLLPEHLPEAFNDVKRFVALSEIASIEKGKTGIKKAVPGEFPLVVTAASRESCDQYDFDAAAAIIPLVSSTGHGNASINRLHYQEGKFALGTILAAVLPHDPNAISARFLFEYLSAFKEELLVSRMTGTANVTLTIGSINEVPVPLLSSQAQSSVDELMALCDRLEEARKAREEVRDKLTAASLARLTAPDTTPEDFPAHARFALEALPSLTTRPDQIKTFRQTILNLAVRGKLVEQDAADEPAETLETAVFEAVCEISSKPGLLPQSNSPSLPAGWVTSRIDRLTAVGTGVTPSKGEAKYYNGGTIPWVNSAATNEKEIKSTPHFVTDVAVSECRLKVYPVGSLVVALYGQGKTRGQVSTLLIPATVNQACAVLQFPEGYQSIRPFIFLTLQQQYEEMRAMAEGGAQPNLNLGKIKSRVIALPPHSEQHRIVAKVDALMSLCDRLEAALTTTDTTRTRLLEALLHEALESKSKMMEAAE